MKGSIIPGRKEFIIQNKPTDFRQLAEDLSPSLLRYFRRYVGDHAVADDLLQETLLRVERGLAGFSARSSLKTWTFSIATRVAADYFRLPEHRLQIVDIEDAGGLAEDAQTPAARLSADQMNACVRQLIDTLPEDYRAALVWHDLEELSVEQTAEICDCSIATAKIRIHRARNRLKAALQQQCSFYRDEDNVFRCERR